jgi:L-alanine-DL-glutamate epimerase-like enolase superfamily enzyme
MKITHIDAIPFDLPFAHPVTFAAGRLAVNENVLIEVHTDEGITGRAEAPSRPFFYGESQKSMVGAIEKWFGPALKGLDPFAIEHVWSAFAAVEHNNTVKGAIDIALHDIMGQALGMPCHRLLGGWGTDVRVTYVCGYGPPESMADEAEKLNGSHGITAFKLKVGLNPEQDAQMLKAVRKRLPEALLYVDGNQGLRAQEALRLMHVAADMGVAWAEEPCHKDDREGRRQLARQTPVPILGDESCRTPEEVAREIDDGAVHLVSIKVARTGFRQSRDIVAHCLAHRIRPMSGSQGDSGIGVVAGLHFCAAHKATQSLPAELCFHLNLAGDLLAEPLQVQGGRLAVPESPGLGIAIDPEKLRRFRVN